MPDGKPGYDLLHLGEMMAAEIGNKDPTFPRSFLFTNKGWRHCSQHYAQADHS